MPSKIIKLFFCFLGFLKEREERGEERGKERKTKKKMRLRGKEIERQPRERWSEAKRVQRDKKRDRKEDPPTPLFFFLTSLFLGILGLFSSLNSESQNASFSFALRHHLTQPLPFCGFLGDLAY